LGTEKKACPKCGQEARFLYQDLPEVIGSLMGKKTGRVIRHIQLAECDHCGLRINDRDELVNLGLEPKVPLGTKNPP
jgi:hypothetical protein